MSHRFSLGSALLLVACAGAPPPAHSPAAESQLRALVDSVARERFSLDSLVIEQIELGSPGLEPSPFRLRITNLAGRPMKLGLDLRTIPGLWAISARQSQWEFEVPSRQAHTAEAQYQFRRLTTEGVLRVQLGGVQRRNGGLTISPVIWERRYPVGRGNPAASDLRRSFDRLQTSRFEIYAHRASPASARMRRIAAQREAGLREIEELLGVRLRSRVLLVFYPDSATKTRDTGHIGSGFASGTTIVEIYNDSVQLDPYHELAHLVAGELGDPPALFDEGFAVYVSERLGAPALRYIGMHGDATVDEAVCRLAARNELIPLAELLHFDEIGSPASRSSVSYPQSASIVKYLIETKGLESFRQAVRTLHRSQDPETFRQNEAAFAASFGNSVPALEAAWRDRQRCLPTL